jgi:hypothetical protein
MYIIYVHKYKYTCIHNTCICMMYTYTCIIHVIYIYMYNMHYITYITYYDWHCGTWITQVWKPGVLRSASWTTSKTSGTTLCQSRGMRCFGDVDEGRRFGDMGEGMLWDWADQEHWLVKTENGYPYSTERVEFTCPLPFCLVWALNRLGDAHLPQREGQFSFSLLDQVPISSRNTITGTPRNNTSPAIWASLSLANLAHKN